MRVERGERNPCGLKTLIAIFNHELVRLGAAGIKEGYLIGKDDFVARFAVMREDVFEGREVLEDPCICIQFLFQFANESLFRWFAELDVSAERPPAGNRLLVIENGGHEKLAILKG